MKNYKKFMTIAAAISAVLLLCSCGPKAGDDSKFDKDLDNYTGDTKKVSNVIAFNFEGATVLATTGNNNTPRKVRMARAAEGDEPLDSLIAITEDEDGNEEVVNVMDTNPELADDCVPKKVVEVYQCPYPTVEEECKGVYTVFDGYIDYWKYTDGTDAPHVGMILYVKPDGTVIDILNFEGDVYHWVQTYVKANDGNDYIKFDTYGNAYILADDGYNSVVYRYSPTNDAVTKYDLGLTKFDNTKESAEQSVWIGNFEISNDGKWIFVRANISTSETDTKSCVYAMEVNSTKEPMLIFENNLNGGWVQTLTYNNAIDTLYFYNWAPQGEDIEKGTVSTLDRADKGTNVVGLYVLERRSDNSFNSEDLKRFNKLAPWAFWNVADQLLLDRKLSAWDDGSEKNIWEAKAGATDEDYKKFITWMKGQLLYEGSIDDIVLDLSYFSKNKELLQTVKYYNEEKKEEERLFGDDEIDAFIAGKDAAGEPLKEVEALKYLLNTPAPWDNSSTPANLMTLLEWKCWNWESTIRTDADKTAGKYGFFLQAFLHHKDGKTQIFDNYCFGHSDFTSNNNGGICICNDEGVWDFVDRGHETADKDWEDDYSDVYRLTDRRGNFELNQPGKLSEYKFKKIYENTSRRDSDPWYKRPFIATTKGFAAISADEKTIYYYTNGEAKDMLASDQYHKDVKSIYAFTLSDDKLIYNATNKRNGYMMVSVDLLTGISRELPLTVSVESILDKK